MSSAIEQLAAELAKLPAEEWALLPEPQVAGQAADAGVAERPIDQGAATPAASTAAGCENT